MSSPMTQDKPHTGLRAVLQRARPLIADRVAAQSGRHGDAEYAAILADVDAALAAPAPDKAGDRDGVDAAAEAISKLQDCVSPFPCQRCDDVSDEGGGSAGCRTLARAALSTENEETGREGAIPAGWKLVPVEPTEDMLFAQMGLRPGAYRYDAIAAQVRGTYRSLVAAAPTPPVSPEPDSRARVERIAEALWDDYRVNQKSITISVTKWSDLRDDSPAKVMHRRQAGVIATIQSAPIASAAAGPVGEDWRPISEAKHDCTLYELMVPTPDGNGLRDAATSLTIGSNNGDHDGEDRWTYVGWDWCQDRYIHMDTAEGDPAPTHFREMRPDPQGRPASEPDPAPTF